MVLRVQGCKGKNVVKVDKRHASAWRNCEIVSVLGPTFSLQRPLLDGTLCTTEGTRPPGLGLWKIPVQQLGEGKEAPVFKAEGRNTAWPASRLSAVPTLEASAFTSDTLRFANTLLKKKM